VLQRLAEHGLLRGKRIGRVAAPRRDSLLRWHGDDAGRRAVPNNRAGVLPEVARQAFKRRADLGQRSFTLTPHQGGTRLRPNPWARKRTSSTRH